MRIDQSARRAGAATLSTAVLLLPCYVGCSPEVSTGTIEASQVTASAVRQDEEDEDTRASDPSAGRQRTGEQDENPSPDDSAASQTNTSPVDNQRILEKTFDDIKFDIEPDEPFERSMLTPEIESMAGQRIRIRGYILPTHQKRGIKQFVLVRDNQECCFGPGAALYDCILVTMNPGKSAEFSIRPVAVEGELEIKVFQPLDRVLAVFHLHGEEVN